MQKLKGTLYKEKKFINFFLWSLRWTLVTKKQQQKNKKQTNQRRDEDES